MKRKPGRGSASVPFETGSPDAFLFRQEGLLTTHGMLLSLEHFLSAAFIAGTALVPLITLGIVNPGIIIGVNIVLWRAGGA